MANFYDGNNNFFDYNDFDENDEFLEDEKIDRVLDEIAEIKKTIAARPDGVLPVSRKSYEHADRLREEVRNSKTQQRLEMEVERLNNRLVDLADEQTAISARSGEQITSSLNKIIATLEELIFEGKEGDNQVAEELESLKKQVIKLSALGDISATLTNILTVVQSSEDAIGNLRSTVDGLAVTENQVEKQEPQAVIDTELIRQFYELKSMIGSASPLTARRNDEILSLYNMLVKAKYDARSSSVAVGEKYAVVDALAKKLSETGEFEVQPVINGVNEIIDELGGLPLDEETFESIIEYSKTGGIFNIAHSKSEAVSAYIDNVSKLVHDGVIDNMDDLPDIIALKNEVQGGRCEYENEKDYSAILSTNIAIMSETDAGKQRLLKKQLKEQIARLTSLEVRDLVSYPKVTLNKQYRMHKTGEGETLYDKISEIRNYLLDANLAQSGGVVTPATENGLAVELTNLKNEIYSLGNLDDISQSVLELKADIALALEKMEERGGVEVTDNSGLITNIPSIAEIVAQLDRLFDDIKNVLTDSENNIMSSLEVLGEALVKFSEEHKASTDSAKADRTKILEDVAFIRSAVENGSFSTPTTSPIAPSDHEKNTTIVVQSGNDGINARLDAIENNQKAILEALSAIAVIPTSPSAEVSTLEKSIADINQRLTAIEEKLSNDAILEEVRTLSDRLFAISMANVASDDGETEFESYNNLILNEIYAIEEDVEDLVAKLEEKKTAKKSDKTDAILLEISKLREEIKKAPVITAQEKAVAPSKKKSGGVKDTVSVNDLLSQISETDIVIKE